MAENSNNLAARVYLRPLGVPLPLGVSGLAIATLVNSGLELHWVGSSQTLEVGVILATVPFALQLIACVFSYLARDGAAGAALGDPTDGAVPAGPADGELVKGKLSWAG